MSSEKKRDEKKEVIKVPKMHMDPLEYRDIPAGGLLYGEYLMLDELLKCQKPVTISQTNPVHDEHLFIITHQAYELWFKQIIYELDSIRYLLDQDNVSDASMLVITSRLNRCVSIMKLLVDQVGVLETMMPIDFLEFRDCLAPASGFQSVQFRLIENKIGVKNETRINYNKNHYLNVFADPKIIEDITRSEKEPSLFVLIERWLERTPGLDDEDFNFWEMYQQVVTNVLEDIRKKADETDDKVQKELFIDEHRRRVEMFDSIFDSAKHDILVARGERRLTLRALQGALMISLYRDAPRFHQPFCILTALMDIDSLITKWRYNHVQMVSRMIGSHLMGTGGSSGYQYLRATLSDRYKVFLDLFNLSTYVVQKKYLPPLTARMHRALSSAGITQN